MSWACNSITQLFGATTSSIRRRSSTKPPAPFGPFLVVELSNGVSLDFYEIEGEIKIQHYAFLISEKEFDQILERIWARGLEYWADPHKNSPQTINHNDGGRGMYFEDPDGHFLEVITRPYGGGP